MSFSCLFPRTKRKWTATLNTLAKYYEGKYHNSIEYQRLMGYSKAVEKADISPLVGFDTYQEYCESVQKNTIVQTTSTGIHLESFALHLSAAQFGKPLSLILGSLWAFRLRMLSMPLSIL